MSGVINPQKKLVVRGFNGHSVQHRHSVTAVRRSGSVETLQRGHGKAGNRQFSEQQGRFSQLESQYIRNLQQQVYFLELENSHLKHQLKKGMGIQPKLIADSEMLMEKLRKSKHENQRTETELKDRDFEVETVLQERALLAERLKNAQEVQNREKEVLCQEIVELRKRLDDCEPDLARKETSFSKSQSELIEATNKLRALQNICDSLQDQLDQKNRESTLSSNLEMDRQAEAERTAENVRMLEKQLIDQRAKTKSIMEDISLQRQKMRELELQSRKEKGISEKLLEENDSLVKENSQLSAKIVNLESQLTGELFEMPEKYELVFSELADTRLKEKQLRQELLRAQEHLRVEQVKNKNYSAQINQEESGLSQLRETNNRLEKQIENLENQARNLSAENQQFRKDRLATEAKQEEVRKALTNKDMELVALRDRLQNAEQQYRALLEQYQQESVMQDQKCREFEQLAQKVKDLSRNIRSNSFLPNSFSPETSNPDEN